MSSSESLWRKSSCPHPGLPVKTNRHGDQACQFPIVGGDWDIIGVSNERRQRIRSAGAEVLQKRPGEQVLEDNAAKTRVRNATQGMGN